MNGEGRMEFYLLCSLTEPPQQLIRAHNSSMFHCRLVLPLPKHLVIFGVGNWDTSPEETFLSVEVSVSPETKSQRIGMLSSVARCLVWQGEWRTDLMAAANTNAERGGHGTLSLTLNGQLKRVDFLSSTPVVPVKTRPALDDLLSDLLDDFCPSFPCLSAFPQVGHAHLQQDRSLNFTLKTEEASCPQAPFPAPLGGTDSSGKDTDSSGKETVSSDELGSDAGVRRLKACPSPRWNHTLCLSDPDTAILIGGERGPKRYCKDGLWRLELDNGENFWFPLETTSTKTIPVPRRVCGHSATYDADTKRVYIFGGVKDEQCFNNVYVLDTLTWKWSSVIGRGKVPSLAYHSAVVFHRELFVFGGLLCRAPLTKESCSNTLYIFNAEHEIWYQPIVVGERPLPRYGHSGTLLRDKLILFGGSRSRVFLNDLHMLDLGFMEYINIQSRAPPPPRCCHAAVPVCGNKMLISGGHNLSGALQDLFIFNIDTYSWSSLSHPILCSVPRTGHSLVYLNSSRCSTGSCHKLLVFGGSDNAGKFYSDTVRVGMVLDGD
ncbi:rab9 effector protein with kelch motifs [Chiloscyllium plagiosum]|uniref:rab9 effector protein with kelch motifs n=1 Tax=Chiloscyllium plagiosum TaxID=36176 RepID=UPI001CB83241|nr:rab9 effector protein with kelch motifs [Chiloscyllium plagiosum]